MSKWILVPALLLISLIASDANGQRSYEKFHCSEDDNLLDIVNQAHKEKREARLLLMSGGGSHGAWGAGFINGWRDYGMHAVDMITGVSAGAMSATFVYLEDTQGLKNLFLETSTNQFYRKRFLPFALFSDSLYSTRPQKKRIKELFTNDVIDRVASRARGEGDFSYHPPILCVGSVNLNTNTFVQWDLAEIAKAGEYDLYRKILKAAVAFPVMFPPVVLGDGLYTDGGLKENIFVTLHDVTLLHAIKHNSTMRIPDFTVTSLEQYRGLPKQQQDKLLDLAQQILEDTGSEPVAYLVINGKTGLEQQEWINRKLLPLTKRAMSIMMNQRTQGNLYRLHYDLITKDSDLQNAWKFRYTEIPDEMEVPCNFMDFDKDCTRLIYGEAYDAGRSNTWIEGFPEF